MHNICAFFKFHIRSIVSYTIQLNILRLLSFPKNYKNKNLVISSIAPNLQVYWFPVLQRIFEFVESHVWTKPGVGKEEGRGCLSDLEASAKLRRRTIEREVNKEVKGNWRLTGNGRAGTKTGK